MHYGQKAVFNTLLHLDNCYKYPFYGYNGECYCIIIDTHFRGYDDGDVSFPIKLGMTKRV